MHISHNSEDSNLHRLLSSSYADIKAKCGNFDITGNTENDLRGKELVFERARYAYNDALEYFDNNFLSQLNSFALSLLPKRMMKMHPFEYKPPRIRTGDLRTPIKFYEYVPNEGPNRGNKRKKFFMNAWQRLMRCG